MARVEAAAEAAHGVLVALVVIPVGTEHGEGLATAGLAVSENRRIEAVEHVIDVWTNEFKDLILMRILVEHLVILALDIVLSISNTDALKFKSVKFVALTIKLGSSLSG